MKWLKRGFWLAAWSFWLWLGFGLHRELPREFGPVVSQLPVGVGDKIFGFVGQSDVVALYDRNRSLTPDKCVLFDATSGREIGERPLPQYLVGRGLMPRFENVREALPSGVLFGSPFDDPSPGEGLQVLDVLKGEWLRLTQQFALSIAIHPKRPWVAIVELTPEHAERAVVMDFRSGKVVFDLKLSTGTLTSRSLLFLADPDRLVLPLHEPRKSTQVWNIADPPVLTATLDGIDGWSQPFRVSRGGRLFLGAHLHGDGTSEPTVFDVYDFNERRFITSVPASEQPAANGGKYSEFHGPSKPAISPSGRNVLRYGPPHRGSVAATGGLRIGPMTLYEVGDGEIRWQASPVDSVSATNDDGFVVTEQWHELWKNWLPNFKFETRACRSLETGELLYRTSKKSSFEVSDRNASRTLVILSDGSVRRLPLQLNYPLLALCQSILALPLILLWAILRWRRNRRLRVAKVRA